jgi:hypothetical protein
MMLDADDTVVATAAGVLAITPHGASLTSQLAAEQGQLPPGRLRIVVRSGRRAHLLGAIRVGRDGTVSGVEPRRPKRVAIPAARAATVPVAGRSIKRFIGARWKIFAA